MIRSVMIKGFEALTAECFLAARRAGVDDAVIASLQASDPGVDWPARGAYNLERMMAHGTRRAAEMREVAATLRELGLPDRMAAAAALWQDQIADLGLAPGTPDLAARADRILAALRMKSNLRHLRLLLAVADHGSITRAAEVTRVSQPAVTQALAQTRPSRRAAAAPPQPAGRLPDRGAARCWPTACAAPSRCSTPRSTISRRACASTATTPQLQALIAMREAENFTLAARRLGLAQPTVHRAISLLEQEAARPLFERTSYGMVATRAAQALAQAARLAFAELDQAEADLAETIGEARGAVVIGAMPLSRSHVLPRAIALFRQTRPVLPVRVLDGPYDDLLAGLRRGEVDVLIGALRDPAPIGDVIQQVLFHDSLALVARPDHPLFAAPITLHDLAAYPWVVHHPGTPTRQHFDALFAPLGPGVPRSIVDSGSLLLMRELLRETDHLACLSRLQVAPEIATGLLVELPYAMKGTDRPIGLTSRRDWLPTRAQRDFLAALTQIAGD